MLVQSIQCDKCKKIMTKDSQDYFTISGELKRGKEYYTANNEDAHICVNCFIKHFNLMVSTTREPLNIEKQGDILKRKIEDYTQQPIPYDKTIRYEVPWEVTCTKDSKPWEIIEKIPTKDEPYPKSSGFSV